MGRGYGRPVYAPGRYYCPECHTWGVNVTRAHPEDRTPGGIRELYGCRNCGFYFVTERANNGDEYDLRQRELLRKSNPGSTI